MLPALQAAGFGVVKLALTGVVEQMLARVVDLRCIAPASLGLEVRFLTTDDEVRATAALRRDYFTSHPAHGWASASLTDAQQSAIDARVEAEIERRRTEGPGTEWVVLAGDVVVGCFGFTTPSESPIVGRNSGFNICLSPAVQGCGLGTLAYRIMVERAAELEVEFMHGMTSNPAAIRIAARIGRHVDNWLLRRDPPWVADEIAFDPALRR